jgi:hypothetical protein
MDLRVMAGVFHEKARKLFGNAERTESLGPLPSFILDRFRVRVSESGIRARLGDIRLDDGLVAWHLEAWKLDHGNAGEELLMPVKKFTNSIRKQKSAMAAAQREKGNTCVQQSHSR